MLFVSYRRSQRSDVEAACAALRAQGATIWLDTSNTPPAGDFTASIRQGLAACSAVLIWWSDDYADSSTCMQEFRLAWQAAWRLEPDHEVRRRVWILDAHGTADHILAGDLSSENYLPRWPPPGDEQKRPGARAAWATQICRMLGELADRGPLAPGGIPRAPPIKWQGRPTRSWAFVGRERELMHLHTAMFPVGVAGDSRPVLVQLHGAAGTGKSALAHHYADTFGTAFPGGVWWLTMPGMAIGPESRIEEVEAAWLEALTQTLGSSDSERLSALCVDAQGRTLSARQVHQRLGRQLAAEGLPCLWVVDNLPFVQRQDLRAEAIAFLSAPDGHSPALVTCRDALALDGARTLALPPLSASDGHALLARYLPRAHHELNTPMIHELVAEVQGHPLALVLLGAMVESSNRSLEPTLRRLRERGVLERVEHAQRVLAPTLGRLAPSVLAIFEFSITPQPPDARRLLALASVCASHRRIPVALIERAFVEALRREDDDDPDTDELASRCLHARISLVRASLMELDGETGQDIAVHPLVTAVALHLIQRPPEQERQALADALQQLMAPLDDDPGAFVALRGAVPHARALLVANQAVQPIILPGRRALVFATRLSWLEHATGLLPQALDAARHAEQLAAGLPHDDPDRLRAATALANALASTGAFVPAIRLLEDLLPKADAVFGDSDEALTIRSLLGSALHGSHRLDEAEQQRRALLQIVRRLPAGRWQALAAALAGLAATRHLQGALDEAELFQREAVRVLDDGAAAKGTPRVATPDALVARLNLAVICMGRGATVPVDDLRSHASATWKLLGGDDATTRAALLAVGDALVGQGLYAQASDEYYAHLLAHAERTLGVHDAQSLGLMSRLIGATGAAGRHEEAAALLHRFIEAADVAIRNGHPDVLSAVEDVAGALNDLGWSIAILARLLTMVLLVRRHDLGEGNLETLRAYINAAHAESQRGDSAEAVALRQGALDAARALPLKAPAREAEIADATFQLVLALDADGRHADARRMEVQAVLAMKALLPTTLH